MLLACETVRRQVTACVVNEASGALLDKRCGGEAELDAARILGDLSAAYPITRLAVAVGPGSFTGLRIGLVAVRTLAWMDNLPVCGVDSLTALAVAAGPGMWVPVLPLKSDTSFVAVIHVDNDHRPKVITASAPFAHAKPIFSLPDGAQIIGPMLRDAPQILSHWWPQAHQDQSKSAPVTAEGVATAARFIDNQAWADLLPMYGQEPGPVLQRRASLGAFSTAQTTISTT